MNSKLLRGALATVMAALLVAGCGLEGLFNQYLGGQYTQPVSVIRGTVDLADPTFTVVDASGNEVELWDARTEGEQFEVQLISGTYTGLRLRAIKGEAILEAFAPPLEPETVVEGVKVDLLSTATVKFVHGLLGPSSPPPQPDGGTGREVTLASLSDELLCVMGKKVARVAETQQPVKDVLTMMDRIHQSANLEVRGNLQTFQDPEVTRDYTVVQSVINPSWLNATYFDYDNDGNINQTTTAFDTRFVPALQTLELSAPPDPERVRLVFTVDFREGAKNLACQAINRFKWTRDEPGRQMYFVGGIHKTSPKQDTEVDAMLGNRGGWTPNQVAMYDDGTNGDEVAGDGVWSIYFDVPRGIRIGYKYTWGKQGMLWTGTEEWPGNQRILEVVDLNDDGYVFRFDKFADETSNKDLANLNPRAGGSLEWNEDLNGDGVPEAQEHTMIDADNDGSCVPEKEISPVWVPALSMPCEDFVAE